MALGRIASWRQRRDIGVADLDSAEMEGDSGTGAAPADLGQQDGGAALWKKVAPDWTKAGLPLTIETKQVEVAV